MNEEPEDMNGATTERWVAWLAAYPGYTLRYRADYGAWRDSVDIEPKTKSIIFNLGLSD